MTNNSEDDKDAEKENIHPRFLLPDDIKPIAEQLGAMVMVWNVLEMQLSFFIGTMLGIGISKSADAVIGHIDLQAKLRIIRSYGFVIKPSDDWFERLTTCVDHIENDLCKERNRMVHDVWGSGDIPGTLKRINRTPKLKKPQARMPLELKFDTLNVTADDIGALCAKISIAFVNLMYLSKDLRIASPNRSSQQSTPKEE